MAAPHFGQFYRLYKLGCHINMSFSMETEKENKLSFLDVEVIREQGKFTTTIYQKPTFSGVYSNFESFYLRFINLVWCIL